MKNFLNQLNFKTGQWPSGNLRYPKFPLFILIAIITLTTQNLTAQCNCFAPNNYVVGTGAPVPMPNLSVASQPGNYGPAILSPGNACITIIGQFDVDNGQTWNLGAPFPNTTQVKFATANSSIFVLNGGNLDAYRTGFSGCVGNSTWLGIYVQTGGKITTKPGCQFQNASQAGIVLLNNSIFDIQSTAFFTCNNGIKMIGQQNPANHVVAGNLFYDCNIGIYLASALDVNIGANEYSRVNIPAMTGIHQESICEDININGGLFKRQTRGISAVKTINLDISNANFSTCSVGIISMEGNKKLLISDCNFSNNGDYGIQVNFHNTNTLDDNDIDISGNDFLQHGANTNIYLKDVSGSGKCTVQDNIIDLPSSAGTGPSNKYGILVEKFYAVEGLVIEENTLTNDNSGSMASGGIFVDLSTMPVKISANDVFNTAATGPMPSHIRAHDCRLTLDITSNTTGGGTPISARGISIEYCPGLISLCCNNLTNSHSGLYITGPLNNAQIFTTTFGNHPFAALHYFNVTALNSQQLNHGNDWSGATGQWNALYQGAIGGIPAAKYEVTNPLNNVGVNGLPDTFGWFTSNGVSEPNCASTTCSGSGGNREGGERSNSNESAVIFSAYPNPADQSLLVSFPAAESETVLSLMDITGRVAVEQIFPIGAEAVNLETAALQNGVYFLVIVQNGRKIITSKVLINHR